MTQRKGNPTILCGASCHKTQTLKLQSKFDKNYERYCLFGDAGGREPHPVAWLTGMGVERKSFCVSGSQRLDLTSSSARLSSDGVGC